MVDSGLHDHIIRSSDVISIPENQPELDTIIPALYNFLFALNVLTCACGTVGNLLTLIVISARFVNKVINVIWLVDVSQARKMISNVIKKERGSYCFRFNYSP